MKGTGYVLFLHKRILDQFQAHLELPELEVNLDRTSASCCQVRSKDAQIIFEGSMRSPL